MAKAVHHINPIDVFVTFVSLITFVLDITTDLMVCIQLLLTGYVVWGWLVFVNITLPAVLMSAFSLSWHLHDKSATWPVVVTHMLLLAPAQRYCSVIYLGIKSYKTRKAVFTQKALRCQSDVSILRLFEAFLESAPQLVLQLYIMLHGEHNNWFTGVSTGFSLLSLTWAMTAYSDSQRRAHSSLYRCRIARLLMHWLWQLLTTLSRIAAFVFCAVALQKWVLLVMGGHWFVSFIWISIRGTDFGTDCCERWVFRLICGFIYIFVFLNLNDGISRWRITAYYILVLLENAGMIAVFVLLGDNNSLIPAAFAFVFGAFFIGLMCMAIYYSVLHPSKPKPFYTSKKNSLDGHETSRDAEPQIFSIESPKVFTELDDVAGTAADVTANSISSFHPGGGKDGSKKRTVQSSGISSQHSALQAVWHSSIEGCSSSSTSSSTSSLSIDPKITVTQLGRRTPSIKSENSQASESSQNKLLPPTGKNNLCNQSGQGSRLSSVTSVCNSRGPADGGENVTDISDNNVAHLRAGSSSSNISGSPTLSRGSWARLSDHLASRQSLGDFTVLGSFDPDATDSSAERRPSDCSSSVTSRPPSLSLSPTNVSSLWKDIHYKLRTTIAATIAAATGSSNNNSSTEGTPNASCSMASSISGQGDINVSASLSQDSEGKYTASSSNRKLSLSSLVTHAGISPSQKQRLDRFERIFDERSKFGEHVIELSGQSSTKTCDSPYPEDSTLTASKLKVDRQLSYLDTFRLSNLESSPITAGQEEPLDLSMSTVVSPVPETVRECSDQDKKTKDASPFTDQELVSVMANSIQGYLKNNSFKHSPNPEREGLALTIEDLRISRETSPSSTKSPQNNNNSTLVDGSWKSRSASSLFHDSPESSLASSASKMNRLASAASSEKFSPNGLKLMQVSPPSQADLNSTYTKSSPISNLPHQPVSQGLKFIMDSYTHSFHSSPKINNITKQKIDMKHPGHLEKVTSPAGRMNQTPNTTFGEVRPHKISRSGSLTSKNKPGDQNNVSFESSPGQGLSAQDLDISTSRAAFSLTKKLNVYSRDQSMNHSTTLSSNQLASDSDYEGYVSGQYCPPLCAKLKEDLDENSLNRNLNYDQKNSRHLRSLDKNMKKLAVKNQGNLNSGRDGSSLYREIGSIPGDMRREVITRNIHLQKQTSDILHIPDTRHTLTSRYLSQPSLHQVKHKMSGTRFKDNSNGNNTSKTARTRYKHHSDVSDTNEQDLRLSAKLVADYFSQALEENSRSMNGRQHVSVQKRAPLQELDNAQHLSPRSGSYHQSISGSSHCKLGSSGSVMREVSLSKKDPIRQRLFFESID